MNELCRFVNVRCEQQHYRLNGISFILCRGETIGIACDTTSARQGMIDLLLRRVEATVGHIEWYDPESDMPMHSCLITSECSCLFHDLSVMENLGLLFNYNHFLYSKKKTTVFVREILRDFDLKIDPFEPVYKLPAVDRYLLSMVFAVGSGASLLILADMHKLLQDSNLGIFEGLLRKLTDKGVTIVFTECYCCAPMLVNSRILCLEDNHLVKILHGSAEFETFNQFRANHHPMDMLCREQSSCVQSSGTAVLISNITTANIRRFHISLRPGEICYMIGRNYYEQEFENALFGKSPSFSISWGQNHYRSCSIAQLKKAGIGYFPENIDSIIFPDLNYRENAAVLVLKQISRWGGIIRKSMFNYISRNDRNSDTENISRSDYENRLKCCISRYLLHKWRLLVLHLPSILRSQSEADALRGMIYSLASSGCSVLILIASPSEIISAYDSRIEFDSEGRARMSM